jgi:hypothetical protein
MTGEMKHPVRFDYFSANEQCFSLTTNQHKPNFSIREQGERFILLAFEIP